MSANKEQPKTLALYNGVEVPSVGFGSAFGNWSDPSVQSLFLPEQAWSALSQAISVGYTHFDTALLYRTQRILGDQVGRAVFEKGGKRSDVFLATKVGHAPTELGLGRRGDFMDYSDPRYEDEAFTKETIWTMFEKCLEDLGVGYVDLLLVHWPGNYPSEDDKPTEEEKKTRRERGAKIRQYVWKAMEEIYQSKQARAVGVSNFNERHLGDLLETCTVKPMVNQLEMHPYAQPRALLNFCKKHDILVEAWSPFGSGAVGALEDEVVVALAEKYGKNRGQVVLRWLIQEGVVVLPKSASKERARGNLDVYDFEMSEEDVEKMRGLDKGKSCVGVADLDLIF